MIIALVGPRGSGKTSVGRRLASRLRFGFVDTDDLVAARTGSDAGDLIRVRGEEVFRRIEEIAVLEALELDGGVVALGGGAVISESTRKLLAQRAKTVWLDARGDVLARRTAGSSRPPLTSLPHDEEVSLLRARREPLYRACAAVRVDTSDMSVEEVCDVVERIWHDLQDNDIR